MLILLRYIILGLSIAACMLLGTLISLFKPFNPIHMYYMALGWGPISKAIIGVKFHIKDFHHMTDNQPCVYIMNHQSNMDIVIAAQLKLRNTVSLGKKEILYFPIFGIWYWLSGNILIKRENKSAVIRSMLRVNNVINKLKYSIIIMPEGTRSKGKGLGEFKSGAFRTAVMAQVPIVPIVVSNWHKNVNANKFNAGEITIKALAPIQTKGLSKENVSELSSNVRNQMLLAIEEIS